jgi:hypothetical protein
VRNCARSLGDWWTCAARAASGILGELIVKRVWLGFFALVVFGISGCSEPEFCEGEWDLAAWCDIRNDSCQQTVFEATDCVRGTSGVRPTIRVITQDEYWAELYGDDDPADAAEPEYNPWDEALRLFGMLTPQRTMDEEFTKEYGETVPAYYSSWYRDITIIDSGTDDDDVSYGMRMLSHEYVHSLQDQDVGLAELRGRYGYANDTSLSLSNLTEGEANIVSVLANGLLSGEPPTQAEIEDRFEWSLQYYQDIIAQHESPYVAVRRHLHYGTGSRYYAQLYDQRGIEGVRALPSSFPVSTVHWMAGYTADSQQHESHSWEQPLRCRALVAPDGYESRAWDTFGASLLFGFLVANERRDYGPDIWGAWNRALEWRGDNVRVFAPPDADETAAIWQIRLSSESLATELQESAVQMGRHWTVVRNGPEVRIFAASDRGILNKWVADSRCEPDRALGN